MNFHGQCYQRLLRYRDFYRFHSKLHLRNAPVSSIVFPKKEWSRQISLQDDVVEARQVLVRLLLYDGYNAIATDVHVSLAKQLNEYMNQINKSELTPGCYDRLLRLLKVGDYDTETKGHAALRKGPATDVKGERPTVDVLRDMENEEADGRAEQFRRRQDEEAKSRRRENGGTTSDRIGGVTTIVNTSVVYRSVASNADTVLTEDERSINERQAQSEDDELDDRAPLVPSSTQSVKQQQQHLRWSVSAPIPRVKKVQFQSPEDDDVEAGPTASDVTQSSDLSPERKYRPQILKHMSSIERMLSELNSVDGHSLPAEFHSSSAILARNRAESF